MDGLNRQARASWERVEGSWKGLVDGRIIGSSSYALKLDKSSWRVLDGDRPPQKLTLDISHRNLYRYASDRTPRCSVF
jgi:hypothetical protein